jgi:hypothetical protein
MAVSALKQARAQKLRDSDAAQLASLGAAAGAREAAKIFRARAVRDTALAISTVEEPEGISR